mmetsp:Transcript_35601/g.53063  ORF Transcript_35601/g.53063 Transcript_35601/m.53063 type:complete len:104 (-) Transcript_35601:300-611(-)
MSTLPAKLRPEASKRLVGTSQVQSGLTSRTPSKAEQNASMNAWFWQVATGSSTSKDALLLTFVTFVRTMTGAGAGAGVGAAVVVEVEVTPDTPPSAKDLTLPV